MGDDDIIPTWDRVIMAQDAGDASVEPTTHLRRVYSADCYFYNLFLGVHSKLNWINQGYRLRVVKNS